MDLKISGKVIEILAKTSGTSASGKAWEKCDFVIEEVEGSYPKQVAFTVFNKPEMIADMRVGDEVDVSFNIEARPYQGKWFSNVTAWKVNITKTSATPPPVDDLPPVGDDKNDEPLPF